MLLSVYLHTEIDKQGQQSWTRIGETAVYYSWAKCNLRALLHQVSVCLPAGWSKNYWMDFHKILWKDGAVLGSFNEFPIEYMDLAFPYPAYLEGWYL